jgi:hypothetical protein
LLCIASQPQVTDLAFAILHSSLARNVAQPLFAWIWLRCIVLELAASCNLAVALRFHRTSGISSSTPSSTTVRAARFSTPPIEPAAPQAHNLTTSSPTRFPCHKHLIGMQDSQLQHFMSFFPLPMALDVRNRLCASASA